MNIQEHDKHEMIFITFCPLESTQTVQALQHADSDAPVNANKEVEIRSLKSEIDFLKKQLAGESSMSLSHGRIRVSASLRYCIKFPLREKDLSLNVFCHVRLWSGGAAVGGSHISP